MPRKTDRTEHSVVYEVDPGHKRIVTRMVCATRDGRYIGTETTREEVYRGWDGWKWTSRDTETKHFPTREDASEWMDAMFCAHDVWLAQQRVSRAVLRGQYVT